jgi:signal transduction histidine kinase
MTGDSLFNETTNDLGHPLSIRCLRATSDGSVWIGYAGWGVGRLKGGSYSRITTAQGLNDDYISQIIDDGQGWLWFAGNHGIFRVQLEQLNAAAEHSLSRVRSITYGRGEGLPNLQANYDNHPAVIRARDGRLLLAMRTGLAVVHTENIRDNPEPPPVLLEQVEVDGKTVALYDSRSPLRKPGSEALDLRNPTPIQLPPDYRKLDVEFTALSFTAPENVHFRYRLDSFDPDWVEGKDQRYAAYARLPPGSYQFHVTACNHSGIWNEKGMTLAVTVLPFFWQTWSFRFASAAGALLVLIAAIRYFFLRRLRLQVRTLQQQAALDKERTRIARDLHDDLGGSLTQVALLLDIASSPLSASTLSPASSSTLSSKSPAELPTRLQQCSTLLRQTIKSVDEIIWAINPRNDNARYLIDYLSQYAVEFLHAARMNCHVDLPQQVLEKAVSPEVRHNLFLVLKEALNNTASHARASEVRLRITASSERLVISVEDDGCGFERPADNSRADGLRNMRQRMEEIGGEFALDSRLGAGTRVSFSYRWTR